MLIDSHIHLGSFSVAYPFVESRMEKVIQMLRDEGVNYALASSSKALHYDCPEGNAEVLAAAKKYKEIIPCLVVNAWQHAQAMSDLEQWRANGYVGVKIHPNCHNYPLNSKAAEPILEFCQKEGLPVLTHSTGGCPLSGAGAIEDVAKKFNELKLIVGHGGIFSDRQVAQVVKDYPQLFLEISVEYEAGKLERTVDMIGPDRILFGSDCPLHNPSVMLQRVRVMKLSKEDEEKILWKNTARLYDLDMEKLENQS